MKRGERGANLVEFAIITVLILLPLFAGIADLGRAFYSYIGLQNASREGARFASRAPDATAEIRAVSLQGAASSNLDPASCTVDLDAPSHDSGQPFRVTITCAFDWLIWPGSTNLVASTEMVIFGAEDNS